jgi:glucose-1-phosphate adenylyltransferase
MHSPVTFILAGGRGERLSPLTDSRAKPILPFLGSRKLIDFTLLNCIRSGIFHISVLTSDGVVTLDMESPRARSEGQAQLRDRLDGARWMESLQNPGYAGTADAVRCNLPLVSKGAYEVLILASDHVYSMDYRALLEFHRRKGARVTVGASEVEWDEADRFGILVTDAEERAQLFLEKPKDTTGLRQRSLRALASMGIYVFDADFLLTTLRTMDGSDFGHDLLPGLLDSNAVFVFNAGARHGEGWFWRDVGTVDSFQRTRIEILRNPERFQALFQSDSEAHAERAGGSEVPEEAWV